MSAISEVIEMYISEFGRDERAIEAEKELADFEVFQFKIAKLEINPGEVLAIKIPRILPVKEIKRMKEELSELFPGIKMIVFEDDIELSVIATNN